MLENQRDILKEYLLDVGGKPEEKTWREILELLDINATEANLKAASDIQRYLVKKGALVKPNTVFDIEVPDGYSIKSAWGKEGSMQYSLKKETKEDQVISKKAFLDELKNYSPKVDSKKFEIDNTKPTIAYEINLPDFHFGRIPVEQAKNLFLTTIAQLVDRVKTGYNIDKFILPVGNDLLNTDNLYYTTTKGTAQFDYDEWDVTWRAAWRTMVDCITWLSTIAPVEVYIVPGNHDFQRAFYIGDLLFAWFRNDDNVSIDNTFGNFKAWQYGKCSVMYEHGELKWSKYPIIFATTYPTIFANTKYREVHTGHYHKEQTLDEVNGIKIRYMPSIAPRSRWEKKEGYEHVKQAQAIKWHKEQGNIGIENVNR